MIKPANLPEVWLRGKIENIPALLQPVAHTLLQSREEINTMLENFSEQKLWEKPAGAASVGFHLQHLTGVLDRLLTYARDESLTEQQLNYLSKEENYSENISVNNLITDFNNQVYIALKQLSETKEETLTDYRSVGRNKMPSTVIGLLFHAAEHTMRHTGQLLVTIKFLSA